MKTQSQLQAALAIALWAISTTALAQGVAGSPFTIHTVDPGPQVVIGVPAPMPIDLDPLGGPWLKNIGDPDFNAAGPSTVDLFESMENVGTEAWGDWHEHLLPSPSGLPDHVWDSVVSVTINGNPITYTATGFGTQTLDLFNFSQPVLPGDIFSIHKRFNTVGSGGVSGAFVRLQQYPTPAVPEPTSFTLLALAMGGVVCRRRRRLWHC